MIWLPDRAAGQNPDWLKQAIMEGGAVYTAMHWVEPDGGIAWKSATNSYYYSGSNVPDHAVAIVGWDDSYSKTNFYLTPPGNGAFIVRNSWGSDWGQGGYFYVSYYDTVFARCDSNTLFHNAEVPGCYSNIYQYDPLGLTRAIHCERDSVWGASIFQACSNESLTAVSFYAIDNNTNYEIRIHTGVRANEPVSGTRQLFNTGTAAWAGYHTVNLSNPVALTTGEQFSIIVKFSTPGGVALLALESPLSGYSSRASASAGESFFSIDGISWLDSATYYNSPSDLRGSNVCIKAYTTFPVQINVSADPPAGGSVSGGGTYNSGSKVTVTASPNTGYSFVNWTEGGATVSTDAAYTFTATADRDLAAHFSLGSSVVYGDVSGDEKIDVSDAILVLRQIVGLITFDPDQVEAANVNGNDRVDVGDAILILRYIVGLITVFPVE